MSSGERRSIAITVNDVCGRICVPVYLLQSYERVDRCVAFRARQTCLKIRGAHLDSIVRGAHSSNGHAGCSSSTASRRRNAGASANAGGIGGRNGQQNVVATHRISFIANGIVLRGALAY